MIPNFAFSYLCSFLEKCSFFLFPQVLTVTKLALPMSKVFTVQWAL